MFRRYYAELCQALSNEMPQIATEMYSKFLISKATKEGVIHRSGQTPFDRATELVDAIESKIAIENGSKSLRGFIALLMKRRGALGKIAARMKARLGEYES